MIETERESQRAGDRWIYGDRETERERESQRAGDKWIYGDREETEIWSVMSS